jgi:hypothetical protein
LIEENKIYVDKIEYMHKLISTGSVYFLSRSRRFGRSLLINTFKELFKGNKKIFEGLYICDKWDWSKTNPVIHLDFVELGYSSINVSNNSLEDFITRTAMEYSIEIISRGTPDKFSEVIEKLHEKTGARVVILVDEYDNPLIDNLNKEEIYSEVRRTLHDFYQADKSNKKCQRSVGMKKSVY